jgi:hypothetical protein
MCRRGGFCSERGRQRVYNRVQLSDLNMSEWRIVMSKYEELSKTFAESVQLQAKYVSDCCEFSNVLFSQMAAYLAWPRDQIAFAPDESSQTEGPICNSNSVRLEGDGNIHFFVLFTVNRFDNVNHRYQLIFPFKVKKLEDSFLLTITGLVEEVLLSTEDTQEMKKVYEHLFAAMKSYFGTPYLDFTSEDFLRRTLP